jgi:REP element-mobilizing transposase RayT
MAKTIAYMITWTTYGTWLQGDKRGYVKSGKIFTPNQSLEDSNKQNLSKEPVKLSLIHRQVVQEAIQQMAKQLNQEIFALSVSSTHVHVLDEYIPMPIGLVVRHYKGAAQSALRIVGLVGRIWTKGFDKRYCFDEQTLKKRINYVKSHNKNSKYLAPEFIRGFMNPSTS